MKKVSCLLIFLFGVYSCPSAFSASSEIPPTENLISKEYGELLREDTKHVLSAPLGWDRRDWLFVGLGTGAVIATAAYLDEPIQKEMQGHKRRTEERLSRFFAPFGFEHQPIILGAFEAGGILFHDDRAKQVAHDGIASSILATGLITGSLKMGFGRSRPFDHEGAHDFSPFSGIDSFPSGHTTQAFAVATVISEHYDSLWIKTVSYGTAAMVGWSRMEDDTHWVSDVLAGALIGTLVAKSIVRFNRERRYQLSVTADGDKVGVKVTRNF